MADSGSAAKSNQRNRTQQVAGRLAYLRAIKFETRGFGSDEKVPSLSEARMMDGANKRLYSSLRPVPRQTG